MQSPDDPSCNAHLHTLTLSFPPSVFLSLTRSIHREPYRHNVCRYKPSCTYTATPCSIPGTVMGCEGTISLHAVAEWGCRHWFSSGVGWSLGSATAEIHWERIGSDKVLWIHPTISHWARSNFSESFHHRSTLTAAEEMTTAEHTGSPNRPPTTSDKTIRQYIRHQSICWGEKSKLPTQRGMSKMGKKHG